MTAVFEGGLTPAAIALGWLLGSPPLATFHFDWRDALLGVAATLPPLGLFWLCLVCPWRPFAEIARITVETLVPLFRDCQLMQLAIIAALAGVGEECSFAAWCKQHRPKKSAARTAFGSACLSPPSFSDCCIPLRRRTRSWPGSSACILAGSGWHVVIY